MLKNRGVFNCSACYRQVFGPAEPRTWDPLGGDSGWDDNDVSVLVTADASYWFSEILDRDAWIRRSGESVEDDWPVGQGWPHAARTVKAPGEVEIPEELGFLHVLESELRRFKLETKKAESPSWMGDWVLANLRLLKDPELIAWFINDSLVLLSVFNESEFRPTRADFERTLMNISSSTEFLEPLESPRAVNRELLVVGNQPLRSKLVDTSVPHAAGDRSHVSEQPGQEQVRDEPTASHLTSAGRANGEPESGGNPTEEDDWLLFGIRPRAAELWQIHGFTPSEAADWQEYFFEPRVARLWTDAGIGPGEAARRRDAAIPGTTQ